jgi:hypothetical protein
MDIDVGDYVEIKLEGMKEFPFKSWITEVYDGPVYRVSDYSGLVYPQEVKKID